MTQRSGRAVIFGALIAAWTGAIAVSGAARADEPCQLQQIVKLDMTVLRDGRVSVPMTISGQEFNMLVDTGGLFSMLTPQSAAALNLRPQIIPLSRIRQYGGLVVDHYVTVHDISLGGLKGSKAEFLIMPERGYPPDIGGVLAPEIMQNYDVDFDFANAAFRLFSHEQCEHNVIYWTHDPHGEVEFRVNEFGQMNVPVMLDGHEIRATIDTGAARSFVSLETIEDLFDIDEKNPDLHLLPGAKADHPVYRYPFKTLSVQSITVNNPDLVIIPNEQSGAGSPKMLLGINVLRQLHLYIAYRDHRLYVTPASAH